jgi:uncharacterized protein YjbI with pentapeptide repeats
VSVLSSESSGKVQQKGCLVFLVWIAVQVEQSGAKLQEVLALDIMSSISLILRCKPKLHLCTGTDFTSAVVDRVAFEGADLRGAIFRNTVLSGATYVGANLEGATFEDALLGYIDVQNLCKNTTLGEDAKVEIGCK